MKKSELKALIREEIKSTLEGVNDDIEAKFSKAVMGDRPNTPRTPNQMKTITPTGKIEVMNVNLENGEYVVDINDDRYKDEDGKALRTTFSKYDIKDPSNMDAFIGNNRNKLKWEVANA